MKNLFQPKEKESLISRLYQLNVNSRRRWGTLSVEQVIPHLTDPLRVALGDKVAQPMKSVLYNSLLGKMVVWFLPWPKGAPTAPEFVVGKGCTPPEDLEKDKQTLVLYMHRFSNHRGKFHTSPVFGNISTKAWSRLMWRHLDHHLRQFGV